MYILYKFQEGLFTKKQIIIVFFLEILPILLWRQPCVLFEDFCEITLIIKAAGHRNLHNGIIRVCQETFGFLCPDLIEVILE